MSMKINQCEPTTIMNKAKEFESKHYNVEIYVYLHRLHAFKVFKVLLSFWPLGARKRSYIRTRHSL